MKLQKLKYIAALIVFLLSTLGVWVNKHYSNGQLFDVSFFSQAESCCPVHCPCCDEETVVYQLSTQTISTNALQISKIIDFELTTPILTIHQIISTSKKNSQNNTFTYFFKADTSPGVLQVFRC